MIGLSGALLFYGGWVATSLLWMAEVAQNGLTDKSWYAPVIAAVGTVLIGLAQKAPAIIRALKEPPKTPRRRSKAPPKKGG